MLVPSKKESKLLQQNKDERGGDAWRTEHDDGCDFPPIIVKLMYKIILVLVKTVLLLVINY